MRDEEKTTSSLDSPVRTRFAPSPTGYLHLGNARIALINYVVALQSRGAFLLRMEDTDPERSRPYYVEAIKEDLKWMGLSWRGEVVFQSQRMEVYRRKAWELWEKGLAYPCFCTREE
ncbi:MAG TPA: glutamate--tRNA ligase, partial [Thermosulfidibacter takaii]|nr:glutamate--tRNA ligase [Thermosulfidibacter takaii]